MAGIGPATSPLPRECSTTEPHGQTQTGAGEGDRTLVVSLENFCSTIELHPHALPPKDTQASSHCHTQPRPYSLAAYNTANKYWWRGKDSNLRTHRGQIYSLLPLTTRPPLQTELAIMSTIASVVKPKTIYPTLLMY